MAISEQFYAEWNSADTKNDFKNLKIEIISRVTENIQTFNTEEQTLWYNAVRNFCVFNDVPLQEPFSLPINLYLGYLRFYSKNSEDITTKHSKVTLPDNTLSDYEKTLAERRIVLEKETEHDFSEKTVAETLVNQTYSSINNLPLNE